MRKGAKDSYYNKQILYCSKMANKLEKVVPGLFILYSIKEKSETKNTNIMKQFSFSNKISGLDCDIKISVLISIELLRFQPNRKT